MNLTERSAPITRREVLVLAAVAAALTAILNWRIFTGFATAVPSSPRDPLLELWSMAWTGHALLHAPLRFFDGNAFWPLGDSVAFTDSLAGYAPVGAFGQGPAGALVEYNLLFLFSYALAFGGAYLLARELGTSRLASGVAGCAFAWAPWRASQMLHLHVLSSGGIPLSLFLLLRGWRRRSPVTALTGWAVAAWQVSLGWNLGLPFVYVLTAAMIALGVLLLRRRITAPSRRFLLVFGGGGLACAVIVLALATPYLRVLHRHPEARRTPGALFYFSPPPRGFVAAPPENLVWGRATRGVRDDLQVANEQELFPGLAILALALVGLAAGPWPRSLRLWLGAAVLVSATFSIGYGFHGGALGYRYLFRYAPGWQGLRTPGRLDLYTALTLALLAAAGTDRVLAAVRSRRPRAALVVGLAASALILVEGYGRITMYAPPPVPPGTESLAAPRLYLPFSFGFNDDIYMYWSTQGFPEIVNGWSGFDPRSYRQLAVDIQGFPDRESVKELRRLGIRTVVLDPGTAGGSGWAHAAARPVSGLGIGRERRGRVIVYTL